MGKKVKINGQWLDVKDADIKEDNEPEVTPENETPSENVVPADDSLSEDEKAEIEGEAKKMGETIAKSITDKLGVKVDNDQVAKLQGTVDALLKNQMPEDSKLSKILNGKDLIKDINELTKEEKIVGFYHALVTNNQVALKALSEGTPADGGFLFPNEFLQEMIREIPNINVMRNEVRVIPMKRDVMNITNLVSGPHVTWTSENATKSTTTARFSQLTLTAYKVAAILYSSDELIEDSDIFDVVSLIISLFSEAIADEEERVIWVGNGTTQPQGIDTAGTIAAIATVGVGDYTDITRLLHALPRKYRNNAKFYMNDTTAQNVELLLDGNNRPLWKDSIADGAPATLKGKSVIISDWVPDRTMYFADMKRTYFLGDRKRMSVKISQDTTQAFTQDMTAIRVVSRVGGQVVQPLAARELTGF